MALSRALHVSLALLPLLTAAPRTQSLPPALPAVVAPYAGDPRLEPIPAAPIHVGNVIVFGDGRRLQMRFPPRVNGQTFADGDNHADLYVLFDEATGLPFPGQLPVLEAVPKGAAPDVPDLFARRFSAVWELSAVTVASTYDPGDPTQRMDSLEKVLASPLTRQIHTTNLFLNCPVVPAGSTVDPGSPPIEQAWFRGTVVELLPYDLQDGVTHPQVMFKFEDSRGNTLPSPTAPHLVLSHSPGEPFYSSVWEVWTVTVPDGFPVQQLRSGADVKGSGLPITSAHIRLNCPVVAVETGPNSGVFEPMPFEPAFDLLRNDFSAGIGRFNLRGFQFDIPQGMTMAVTRDALGEPIGRTLQPNPFASARTFLVAGVEFPVPNVEPLIGLAQQFPRIAAPATGNFVPLILQRPFATTPAASWPPASSPDTAGATIRFTQAELDAAYQNNPPRLPDALERNIGDFIANGLLGPEWAPGHRPYYARLALIGRALHELTWAPEQGINTIDTTSCVACHSLPAAGGASRGLYTLLDRDGPHAPLQDTLNGGSMFGSGGAELLVQQLRSRGQTVTEAHGSTGERDTIRHFVSKAQNAHFGVQSVEQICEQTGATLLQAATMDPDADGIVNEATVGEVTAQAAFLLSLPVPDVADALTMRALGIAIDDVFQGQSHFRQPIASGGAGCAGCHTPFHLLSSAVFQLRNPETGTAVSIPVSHHLAEQDDVDEGYAHLVGEPGLRTYGDFRRHRMGPQLRSAGSNSPELLKTAELWDIGSAYPYLRAGTLGSDLRAAILAHEGLVHDEATVAVTPLRGERDGRVLYRVSVRNNSAQTLAASATEPLRLVVVGPFEPRTAEAEKVDGLSPDGTAREGAYWAITEPIPPGGTAKLQVSVRSHSRQPVRLNLVLAEHQGFSEAVASARAFRALPARSQQQIIDFLRAQLAGGAVAEGGPGPIVVGGG